MGNNNATSSLTEEERSKVETKRKSVSVETTQEQMILAGQGKDGTQDKEKESSLDGKEYQPQSMEFVKDSKLRNVEEEMHQTSATEGVETVSEAVEVKESGTEKKPSLVDDIVFNETVEKEEKKMNNEPRDKLVPEEEVLKQRTDILENKPQEILNLVVGDDEVANEGKSVKVISKPSTQESNTIQETHEKDMEPRSVAVSHNDRVTGDSLVQELVSEVMSSSRNKIGLEKVDTTETLDVSCVESNKAQEAITESNKEARVEMRSPSFGNETTEKTPLLSHDKTETYETTIDVEERSVKTRGIEMSLGLLNTEGSEDKKGSEDDLLEKKDKVTKRSKSSLLGTCLCCATATN